MIVTEEEKELAREHSRRMWQRDITMEMRKAEE
jgi:hypothetical protein